MLFDGADLQYVCYVRVEHVMSFKNELKCLPNGPLRPYRLRANQNPSIQWNRRRIPSRHGHDTGSNNDDVRAATWNGKPIRPCPNVPVHLVYNAAESCTRHPHTGRVQSLNVHLSGTPLNHAWTAKTRRIENATVLYQTIHWVIATARTHNVWL